MSEEKSLIVRPKVTLSDWEIAKEFGEYAARSGIGNQYNSALKAFTAKELGLSSIAGLSGIHIIEGKPSLAPKLAWGIIMVHSEFNAKEFKESRIIDEQGIFLGWEITLSRTNGITASRRFILDDAKRILVGNGPKHLIDKNNWRDYPENCCYWRVMGFVQDVVFPDVTLGLYRADELEADITPGGEVIIEPVEEKQPIIIVDREPIDVEPTLPDYGYTLKTLLETVSDKDILLVNNGTLPVSDEDINLAVHRLIEKGILNNDKSDS